MVHKEADVAIVKEIAPIEITNSAEEIEGIQNTPKSEKVKKPATKKKRIQGPVRNDQTQQHYDIETEEAIDCVSFGDKGNQSEQSKLNSAYGY